MLISIFLFVNCLHESQFEMMLIYQTVAAPHCSLSETSLSSLPPAFKQWYYAKVLRHTHFFIFMQGTSANIHGKMVYKENSLYNSNKLKRPYLAVCLRSSSCSKMKLLEV